MKAVTGLLLAVLAAGDFGHVSDEPARTWTQVRGGSVWTLTTRTTEVTGPHGWAGELVRFTVRRDGRFLHHRDSFDGGRVAGMKTHFGGRTLLGVYDVLPEAGAGWIVVVASSTGNAWSWTSCIVTPEGDRSDHYAVATVETANSLEQRVVPNGVEMVGVYQEWGAGGTASSQFIPFRLVVEQGGAVRRQKLPEDPAEIERMFGPLGFKGIFVAGLRERQPGLMQRALDELFVEEPEPPGGFGLPTRRDELQRMVDQVRAIATASAELREMVPWIPIEDVNPPLR